MAKAFKRLDVNVDYLFSGRPFNRYFDMDVFGNARYFHGLTFATKNDKISYVSTLRKAHLARFIKEVQSLDISGYDLVISDFEPITAWRSRFSQIPSLGIGHQYAFHQGAPWPKYNWVGKAVLSGFAPVKRAIGVHWHHFNGTVVPPIIDVDLTHRPNPKPFALVYLPFHDAVSAAYTLQTMRHTNFVFYSPSHKVISKQNNITLKPLSTTSFRQDLQACTWLISSCGFGLVSEALHLGIPILSIPLKGQGEQLANAIALEQLGYAERYQSFSRENVEAFLDNHPIEAEPDLPPMQYPNVADALARYCAEGAQANPQALVESLWQKEPVPDQKAA